MRRGRNSSGTTEADGDAWWDFTTGGQCSDPHEPNDTAGQASPISYGQTLTDPGICPAGDVDYYTFSGGAGDTIVADIDASTIGSSLDSYLTLYGPDGVSVLDQNDDYEDLDSQITYSLPADGTYYLMVREYNHPNDGGIGYFYHISLHRNLHANWTSSAPNPDGQILPGEWDNAASYDITVAGVVSQREAGAASRASPEILAHERQLDLGRAAPEIPELAVTLYAMNDADHLYLAIDNPNDTGADEYDQMGLYFDDNPLPSDGQWTNTSCGNPDGEGNFWVMPYGVDYREWIEGPATCEVVEPAPGTTGAVGHVSGHAQAEVAIDLPVSALRAAPGDVINMYLWIYNSATGLIDGKWPEAADFQNPSTYGALTLANQIDAYEPDDIWEHATSIEDGVPQTHSIVPVGDEDWVTFSLAAESAVALETSGPSGDTRMWLYDSNLDQLEYSDDDGDGLFSYIDRVCGTDALAPGTYYVQIDEYSDDGEIPTYDIAVDVVQVCDGDGHALAPGWNLLALRHAPLPAAEPALDEIGTQGGDADLVARWLSDSDVWESHAKTRPYNNYLLELGQGYFVRAAVASTWVRTGPPPADPAPMDLEPMWALIGIPKLPGPMTAADLLAEATAQGGACTEIDRWDQPTQTYESFDSGMPGTGFDLTEDEGYFVKCANAITYTPGGSGALQRPPSTQEIPVGLPVLEPVADPAISDVLVTNRRDVALSITWRTDQPSTGWVEYGEKTALGQTAHDDLGEGTVSQVHHVTLTRLTPETTYYFRVHSGETADDNDGALYKVTTKETGMPPVPYLAYGQVETADGQPAAGALVRVWLVDKDDKSSEPLSTLVDGYGYWSMSLPVDRCKDLDVRLQAIGRQGSEAELTQSACEVKPAPTVKLSEEGPLKIYLPLILR